MDAVRAGVSLYVTSEPIGLEGGLNTYVYSYNNPTRWTDLMGLAARGCICSVYCVAASLSPWVRYTKTLTCVQGCGEITREQFTEDYFWSPRPFVIFRRFKCDEFPGNLPGNGPGPDA